MTEADRLTRNVEKLAECDRGFRNRLATVIGQLQSQGYRPRIQEAWRSPAAQLAAFHAGHSHVPWGFHCATGPEGEPQALAADVLDDDFPENPRREYLLALTRTARNRGLTTGIDWGMLPPMKAALNAALATGAAWPHALGWDPTHVECTGITIAEAQAGKRMSAA